MRERKAGALEPEDLAVGCAEGVGMRARIVKAGERAVEVAEREVRPSNVSFSALQDDVGVDSVGEKGAPIEDVDGFIDVVILQRDSTEIEQVGGFEISVVLGAGEGEARA